MKAGDPQKLPLAQKIGQLFFIGLPGPSIDETASQLLSEVKPGGVCLFARNIRDAEQTRTLLDGVNERLPVQPFLSIDQEGGLVDRLRRVITPMPAASRIRTDGDAERLGRIAGETIRILGFNMNFAPVIDVINEHRASFSIGLQSRGFGRSPAEVTELAGAFVDGLASTGVLGCLKHFPGLGAAEVDSHEELPSVRTTPDELETVDLAPYRAFFGRNVRAAVMVAHAAYPASDLQERDQTGKLLPASLSHNFVTKLLRQHLGFDGVVITDDLEMGAIIRNYGIGEASKRALVAGQDMLAICANPAAILESFRCVSDAVSSGEITEARIDQSLARIAALKGDIQPPAPFNPQRLAELSNEIADLNASLN